MIGGGAIKRPRLVYASTNGAWEWVVTHQASVHIGA